MENASRRAAGTTDRVRFGILVTSLLTARNFTGILDLSMMQKHQIARLAKNPTKKTHSGPGGQDQEGQERPGLRGHDGYEGPRHGTDPSAGLRDGA
jgi:hypothetical protein